METTEALVKRALIETQVPPTPVNPIATPARQSAFDWRFETFGEAALEHMLQAARELANEMVTAKPGDSGRWLALSGESGAGKTYLAKQIHRYWQDCAGWISIHGKAGLVRSLRDSKFLSWRRFMERQRAGGFEELQDVRALPFLVIDDIGAEHDPNGFAKARLDELIDGRLGKWTVITTNLSLAEIHEKLDGRIASRMKRGGSRFIETTAGDFWLR